MVSETRQSKGIVGLGRLPAVALCGLLVGFNAAEAAEVVMFKPFGALSIQSPAQPVPPGGPFSYAASGPDASWGVVAWDIPGGNLPPFVAETTDGVVVSTSQAAEASVKVIGGPAGRTAIGLSQDGAVLPCLTAGGAPRESDLLIFPNNGKNAFNVSGWAETSHAYPLTALRHLTAITTVSYDATLSSRKEVCGVAQASVMIAVILSNPVRHQTLFYQLSLALICGPQPEPRLAFCQRMRSEPRSNFFFRTNPFGVDDRLPLVGQAFLSSGESRTIHADLLPRLVGFLRAGPLALDSDPSHWTIGAFYAGQNIWGGVALATH